LHLTDTALAVFARLYDEEGTPPRHARLPALHAGTLQGVLNKLAAYPHRLADLRDDYTSTEMWHETMQQKDATIHRRTIGDNGFVTDASNWALSGPHIFLCNPFHNTPRRLCTEKGHYDQIDLEAIRDDYLPRPNYIPACDAVTYRNRTPKVPWDGRPVTGFYCLFTRSMLSQAGERTLLSTVSPQMVGHIDPIFSMCF
jgi:hypothetical protein